MVHPPHFSHRPACETSQRQLVAAVFRLTEYLSAMRLPIRLAIDALRRCQQGSQIRGTPSFGRTLGVRCCSLRRLFCSTSALPACDSCVGLARSLPFLPHEAMVAGHLRWAVGARSAPPVEQGLRATIRQSRPVRRLLERLDSPVSSPATEPFSLMLGFAWSYSLPFALPKTWQSDPTVYTLLVALWPSPMVKQFRIRSFHAS